MDSFVLALIVFSAQLLVIVSVATVVETVCGVSDPRLRLAYWRAVAGACLALPFSAVVGPQAAGFGALVFLGSLENAQAGSTPSVLPAVGRVVWWVLCVVVLARLGLLCATARWLRLLRRRSRRATLTPDVEAIRVDVAPHAEFRISSELAQPAAFGVRHPIVLLPERFFEMDATAQCAVACHELLHVARRDWVWIAVEDIARALFWYHPAVWWLADRIEESREQLVDRLVIARIPSKRVYMAALLAFADSARPSALATAFLRRRHLRSRLQALAKESFMSRSRLVGTAAVLSCVMASAIAGTAAALPLRAPFTQTQQVVNGKDAGVTLPKLISEVKPQYTPEALQARIQGSVMMDAVVRTDGTPTDIEVIRSLDAEYGLDNQAVAALSKWRFEPGRKDDKPVPVRITVEMQFTLKK
jgi:TonB family protein